MGDLDPEGIVVVGNGDWVLHGGLCFSSRRVDLKSGMPKEAVQLRFSTLLFTYIRLFFSRGLK